MKKFISLIIITIALIAYAIYNKDQLNIWFGMNDHQQAAYQYWFTNKNKLDETGVTGLPFNESVKTFAYSIKEPVEQEGKYYFETILYINNQHPLPLFTVVKAINGVWTVDQEATFFSTGDASIQYYLGMYSRTVRNSKAFLKIEPSKPEINEQLKYIEKILMEAQKPIQQ